MNCWKIKKLHSKNFRNLKDNIFDFSPGINCIFGQNGNGKTNLLEAVYFTTNKKSFRKNTDYPQFINIEGEESEIVLQTVFESQDGLIPYSIRLNAEIEERYLSNKLEKKKTPSTSVFINPFDSYQFHTSSSFRRQFIDSCLSQIDKEYKSVLAQFQKSLRFRNGILSIGGKSAILQLRAIDEQVSEFSEFLTKKRLEFFQELNKFISPTFSEIFHREDQLVLELESMFTHWDKKKIYEFYRHQESEDLKNQITNVGIHRDDFIFMHNGLNAFEFCSLGQQKMSFLSLIFAYIELFRYKFSSYPIVLIDDVSGELDSQRWENLIQYLERRDFQVLISTANENFGKELEKIKSSKKFIINNGSLINHG